MTVPYTHTNLIACDRITWCYITDPEGNIIELQAWHE